MEKEVDETKENVIVEKPERPVALPVTVDNVANIPQDIRDKNQWVNWRYEYISGRWTKVPYSPDVYNPERHKARSNDPKTWGSFEDAIKNYNNEMYGYDGIGFQPSTEDDYVCIDLDHVTDENNKIKSEFKEVVRLFKSYTEVTPGGKGLRIVIKGKLPSKGRKHGSYEVYDRVHFLTITGGHYLDTPFDIEERQDELDEFLKKYFLEEKEKKKPIRNTDSNTGKSFLTDEEVIKKARNAKNGSKFKKLWEGDWSGAGYRSQSEGDSALCCHLAFWTNKDIEQMDRLFRQTGLFRDKWDEGHGTQTYGEMTTENAAEQISETYIPNSKSPPQAEALIELALADINFFFTNQYNEAYCFALCGDHKETIALGSQRFSLWLRGLFYRSKGKGCSPDALKTAIGTLAAKALFEDNKSISLHNRVAMHEGALYYDLSDSKWRSVRITQDGWGIVESPCIFNRYKNQKPQLEPSKNGNIEAFLPFVNISNKSNFLLFIVWLITAFIPGFPHCILHLYGPQGSAKSWLCRLCKKLIDPGTVETESIPEKQTDLIKKLSNNWFTALDNLSQLSPYASDTICRAVTGGGHSERLYYTNNEELLITLQRVVALNGINKVATRSDLLDRTTTVSLDRISNKKYRPDTELEQEFAEKIPEILGGIFDTLSKALATYPKVRNELKELPRMADFGIWGYCVGEALGGRGKEFLAAYNENSHEQNLDVVENSPIAKVIVKFVDECIEKQGKYWEGSAEKLYKELKDTAQKIDINTNDKRGWPQSSQYLMKGLNRLKVNLNEMGIIVETKRNTHKRWVEIHKRLVDEPSTGADTSESLIIPLSMIEEDPIEAYIMDVFGDRKPRPQTAPPKGLLHSMELCSEYLPIFKKGLSDKELLSFKSRAETVVKYAKVSLLEAEISLMSSELGV